MTALLGLRNLSKRFGYRTILQELNLDIQAGECVLLLGNNGAGKSTLLRLCATLLKPQQGQILYEGMPIDEDKHRYLRDMGSIKKLPSLLSRPSFPLLSSPRLLPPKQLW